MVKAAKPRWWRIRLVRQKAVYLGTVADDDKSAIEAGAKEFGYPAWRLIAEPME